MTRRVFLLTPLAAALAPRLMAHVQDDASTVRVGVLGRNGRYAVASMPLETYVARVLAGEAARESRTQALEALAIAIRTYAAANRTRHRADGFELCDQTHCQVLRAETTATERAARSTAGLLLCLEPGHRLRADGATAGQAASVFYTASCGGRTEVPSAVWPGAVDPPYLPIQEDDACQGAPAWSAALSVADLHRAFGVAGFRGRKLKDVAVSARNASGRVAQLELRGLEPATISGQDLRVAVGRTLGWQFIKSTAFTMNRSRDDDDVYQFSGHGSGHGVGLCVLGATRLAERGFSADQILARYYPGLSIR